MKNKFILLCVIILSFLGSCRKDQPVSTEGVDKNSVDKFGIGNSSSLNQAFAIIATAFEQHDDDSIERPSILGSKLVNPYLIPNMQQAYSNLAIYNVPVVVTNLYVR